MRVFIKSLKEDHAKKISMWKSDPFLAKKIMSKFEKTDIKKAREWIVNTLSDQNQKLYGIFFNTNDKEELLIGISRLMFIDYDDSNAELGIYIGDEGFQNLGLGSEALKLTLKKGFDNLDLNKIYLKVSTKNSRAIKLYLKNKFIIEGCLKEHFLNHNEFEDVNIMSLFREKFN